MARKSEVELCFDSMSDLITNLAGGLINISASAFATGITAFVQGSASVQVGISQNASGATAASAALDNDGTIDIAAVASAIAGATATANATVNVGGAEDDHVEWLSIGRTRSRSNSGSACGN